MRPKKKKKEEKEQEKKHKVLLSVLQPGSVLSLVFFCSPAYIMLPPSEPSSPSGEHRLALLTEITREIPSNTQAGVGWG